MNFESFSCGDSLIHRLDPRCKVVALTLFTLTALFVSRTLPLLLLIFLGAISIVVARLNFKKIISRILVINCFIGFLWIFVPFSVPGEPLYRIWHLSASMEGIRRMLDITLKCNAIAFALIAYASTIPVILIGQTLFRMGINKKMIQIFVLFYRYLEVINQEYQRLMTSAKVRGFKPSVNIHTYRTLSNLVGMLLVRSWERAERIHTAMICRGYRGKYFSLKEFSYSVNDKAFLVFISSFCLLAIIININIKI